MSQATLVIPGITDPSTLACIARSRTYKQYCIMVENALANRCPFCEIDPAVNKILVESASWRAWQSPAPEKHTKHHFILVPRRHVIDTEDLLLDGEACELFQVMRRLREMHGYSSRGILIRDGDATLSAGTIEHLHIHVMVPDGTGRVESPFYKGSREEEIGVKRAIVFEKLRQGTISLPKLSLDEELLVKDRV